MKSSSLLIVYKILGEKTAENGQTRPRKKPASAINFDDPDYKDCTPIGDEFQAVIPDLIKDSAEDSLPYRNTDHLLWNPNVLPEEVVNKHLNAVGVIDGCNQSTTYNEEVALYELHKAKYKEEEAHRRYVNRFYVGSLLDLWSEEDKQVFYQELKKGKDFVAIKKVLVHKSVQELVDFYYANKYKCKK